MKKPVSGTESLLTMFGEINSQLEELHAVIETSFSDLRSKWWHEEIEKIAVPDAKLSRLEERLQTDLSLTDAEQYPCPGSLKLEMGF